MQTHLNTHIMFITIKTHYSCSDDTLGKGLDLYSRINGNVRLSDSYQSGIYEDGANEDGEDTKIFLFTDLQALEDFLYYLLAKAAMVLAHSTGDDSFYDYTPSFRYQYEEFLKACENIDLVQANQPEYLRDSDYTRTISFPRALKLNQEFLHQVFLSHAGDWFED